MYQFSYSEVLADSPVVAFTAHGPEVLLDVTCAAGAAIYHEGECYRVGRAPAQPEVDAIADWFWSAERGEVFATDMLARQMPGADAPVIKDFASGVAAVAISAIHLLKAFMDVSKTSDRDLAWYVGIHMTFVVSGIILAITDRISAAGHADHAPAPSGEKGAAGTL